MRRRLARAGRVVAGWLVTGPTRWVWYGVIRFLPLSQTTTLTYARLLLNTGRYSLASRVIAGSNLDRTDPAFLVLAATAATGAHLTIEAASYIEQAKQADPSADVSWERLAQLAERAGETHLAISAWSHIVANRPDLRSVLRCGALLSKVGRHRQALATYQAGLDAGLDDLRLFLRAADAASKSSLWKLSEDLWSVVVRHDPSNETAHLRLLRAADNAAVAEDSSSSTANLLLQLRQRLDFDDLSNRARQSAELRDQRVAARTGRQHEPWHLLLVCHHNWSFMTEIIGLLERDSRLEVRSLDTFAVFQRVRGSEPGTVPEYARDLLDWADVVFVEWVNEAADWLMSHVPERAKVVMRLHSYELLRRWPLLVDWGRVDDCVFVAEHNRQRMLEAWNIEELGCRTHVIPNITPLSTFDRPKVSTARWTLGMAGYNTVNKNPVLALDILEGLRTHDERWTLRLAGHPWPDPPEGADPDDPVDAYGERFRSRLEPHLAAGTVTLDPWTADLPAWFTNIGVIVSCSDREGTHEAVREGIASRAVPIVRRWPWAEGYGGADRAFPESFCFSEPEEAVAYLVGLVSTGTYDDIAWSQQRSIFEREAPDVLYERFVEVLRP